jgi:hypothetical protein
MNFFVPQPHRFNNQTEVMYKTREEKGINNTPEKLRKKCMRRSRILGVVAAAGMLAVATSADAALTWSTPLTLNSPDLVGFATTTGVTSGGDPATEILIAQELINVGPGYNAMPSTEPVSGSTQTYVTSATTYTGTLTLTGDATGGDTVAAGYQYVIVKYGGGSGNGGLYVLFYLGGQAATLPDFPANLNGDTGQEAQISGSTAFNATGVTSIPEPSTLFAGALLLLPYGASVLRSFRKRQ